MKKYTATYWRENPQLKNGGYETTRTIEAKTPEAAKKKAEAVQVAYGSLRLIDIEEAAE